MSAANIPISTGLADFSEVVSIDNVPYMMRFRWNTRMGAWFVDILTPDGVLLLAGRRCVADGLLLEQYKHLAIPQGFLLSFDTTNRQIDPGLIDFGTRVLLVYLSPDEIAQ